MPRRKGIGRLKSKGGTINYVKKKDRPTRTGCAKPVEVAPATVETSTIRRQPTVEVAPATVETSNVRRQPTEDTFNIQRPQQVARFRNASRALASINSPPINELAFQYSARADGIRNAGPRSNVAERQAKSRAMKKYITCVQSLGSEEQQALIIRDASVRPEIRVPSKSAGFNDVRATSLAMIHQDQQKKMIARAF